MSNDVEQYRGQALALSHQFQALMDSVEKLEVPDDIPQKRNRLRQLYEIIAGLESEHLPVSEDLRQRERTLSSSIQRVEEVEELLAVIEGELSGLLARVRRVRSGQPGTVVIPLGPPGNVPAPPALQVKPGNRRKKSHDEKTPDLFGWNPPAGNVTPPNSPAAPQP